MKLIEAWLLSEKLLERYGKRSLNEKRYYQDGKPQRRISFDKIMELQPPEISVGEATYPVEEYAKREFPVTTPLEPREVTSCMIINPNQFEETIRKVTSIKVPLIGDVHIDAAHLMEHIKKKERELSGKRGKIEAKRRKMRVRYFWMTLENPQEIWINNDNRDKSKELSYVCFRQFETQTKKGQPINMAMLVVVDGKLSVNTYYSETGNAISSIYNRRWGAKIFPITKG